MADWRDALRAVLQGVTTSPMVPPPASTTSLPLPPLGRFGMQALNLAQLPASIPRRSVQAAPFMPAALAPQNGGGTGEGGGGNPPTTINIPPGVPVVPGNGSRIPDNVMDDATPDSGSNDATYTPPPPVTAPNPLAGQSITYPVPTDLPPGATADPVYSVPPGATITQHSDILNPGTQVGDFLQGPPGVSIPNPLGGLMGGGSGDSSGGSGLFSSEGSFEVGNPFDVTSRALRGDLNLVDAPMYYDSGGGFGDPYSGDGNIFLRELERLRREGATDSDLAAAGYKV